MTLVHHIKAGSGLPPIVFVHGFACGHDDWSEQVRYFSARHQTIALDLPGHGESAAPEAQCTIETFAASVAELLLGLGLQGAVLVGHSLGCRIVTEAAAQNPGLVSGLVFVDGSQFAPAMGLVMAEACATPDSVAKLTRRWFQEMFTDGSDPATVNATLERALRLPFKVARQSLLDIVRYDTQKFESQLSQTTIPVLAIQSTYTNERRERRPMQEGQSTPFLEMLRARLPDLQVRIIEHSGHFPQIEQPEQTNRAISAFLASLG